MEMGVTVGNCMPLRGMGYETSRGMSYDVICVIRYGRGPVVVRRVANGLAHIMVTRMMANGVGVTGMVAKMSRRMGVVAGMAHGMIQGICDRMVSGMAHGIPPGVCNMVAHGNIRRSGNVVAHGVAHRVVDGMAAGGRYGLLKVVTEIIASGVSERARGMASDSGILIAGISDKIISGIGILA